MLSETRGTSASRDPLAALRRFTRAQPPMERCELCGVTLNAEHPHLLERQTRRIACACPACALLFCGQPGGRYLQVPRRVRQLSDFAFTDGEWEQMMLPIGLAFFVRNAQQRVVALYPSPAGVVESLISLDGLNERLAGLEPEVEALLVNRIGADRRCFLVPIDECFRLAGLIRRNWRGLSGGPLVWEAVARFFDELGLKAAPARQVNHA